MPAGQEDRSLIDWRQACDPADYRAGGRSRHRVSFGIGAARCPEPNLPEAQIIPARDRRVIRSLTRACVKPEFAFITESNIRASAVSKGRKKCRTISRDSVWARRWAIKRLDLCDLYAFQAPADSARTVLILNANPNADALHPDAIYRLNIDNDGDCLTDIAFSYVFAPPQNGRQTVSVFVAQGEESRSPEAVGTKIISDAEVSFSQTPNIIKAGAYTFFAGARSDAFFFDFDGIKGLFDTRGKRNFTKPHLGQKSPWTGVDSNTEANVFSTVMELPTSAIGGKAFRFWGRCSVRKDGQLIHADRAGHPSVSSFFNTDDTKLEYNASEPVNDRDAGSTNSFICLGIPAATPARKRSPPSMRKASCPIC